jgi:hypothetical protein
MTRGLRLLVYDRTCAGAPGWLARPGLTTAWTAGSWLYRGLGRIDAAFGADSWDQALAWLARAGDGADRGRPIAEVQYWGHGKWGRVLVDKDPLAAGDLRPDHRRASAIDALRERLAPHALFWLRTCEAFGAHAGHDFAMRLADRLGVRVAGHTYIIAVQQSGLHGLLPGHRPDWPADEGLKSGTPEAPTEAHWSSRSAPRTITCFHGAIPDGWFA